MIGTIRKAALIVAGCMLSVGAPAQAQEYPARPISIMVPFPPGGTTDILARELARFLQPRVGVPVVVQNQGGASGTIGSAQIARAVGDGHVLLLTATHHVINPALYENLPYDTRSDFTPLVMVASAPNVLIVHPSFPAQTVADLIKMAREKPGSIDFASSGVGGANHLAGELLKIMAGIDITHIPYKGASPALNDLMAGVVPVMVDGLAAVKPQLESGRIRALAVTTRERSPSAPQIPTLDESGVAGFDVSSWFGLYAPAKLPPAVLQKLSTELDATLHSEAFIKQLDQLGVVPGTMKQAEFSAFVDEEIKKWQGVVDKAGIPKHQ